MRNNIYHFFQKEFLKHLYLYLCLLGFLFWYTDMFLTLLKLGNISTVNFSYHERENSNLRKWDDSFEFLDRREKMVAETHTHRVGPWNWFLSHYKNPWWAVQWTFSSNIKRTLEQSKRKNVEKTQYSTFSIMIEFYKNI